MLYGCVWQLLLNEHDDDDDDDGTAKVTIDN